MSNQVESQLASKESVAYQLMRYIMSNGEIKANDSEYRKKVLDLYNECLEATHYHRNE